MRYEDSSSCCRFLAQRALAALRADSDLSSGVIFAARALPPFSPPRLPSSTAAGFFSSLTRRFWPKRSGIAGKWKARSNAALCRSPKSSECRAGFHYLHPLHRFAVEGSEVLFVVGQQPIRTRNNCPAQYGQIFTW